jgi:hypothetical protein
MMRLIILVGLFALTTGTCDFNITLTGIQCDGLQQVAATTTDDCLAECCKSPSCSVWEFCPQGDTCTGFVGPSCWIGTANLSECLPQLSWNGAARVVPPTPPPPAQQFAFPLQAAVPLMVADLASTGSADMSWVLSVDNGPTQAISVPGGGYNSDDQDAPYLDR